MGGYMKFFRIDQPGRLSRLNRDNHKKEGWNQNGCMPCFHLCANHRERPISLIPE